VTNAPRFNRQFAHQRNHHAEERNPADKPGCDTQVIVVKTADSLDDLRCGGTPMLPLGAETATADIDSAFAVGNLMGKRYVDDGGAEVLVTKAGAGTLAVGTMPLHLRAATPLPAGD
jgi:hypothetical protein